MYLFFSQLQYGEQKLEAIPACIVVSGVLGNCFKESEHFSQREMDLGRDIIASYYIFHMRSLRVNNILIKNVILRYYFYLRRSFINNFTVYGLV